VLVVTGAGIATVGVVGVVLTVAFFLRPASDRVVRADAVVVPSGDYGERAAAALRLIDRGVASTLVLVGEPDSQAFQDLCRGGQRFEVVCLRPHPDNTRAEARATAQLARTRAWRTVAVVTSTYHVTRARVLWERCFQGRVLMVDAHPSYSRSVVARSLVHEWGGLLQATFVSRTC